MLTGAVRFLAWDLCSYAVLLKFINLTFQLLWCKSQVLPRVKEFEI